MRFLSSKAVFLTVLAMIVIVLPHFGYCAPAPRGWGETASEFMGPVTLVGDFVINACIVAGGTFLFATFIKYRQHRINPLHVPISTVVFLLILSILLLCLPLVHYVLEYLEHAS